MMSSAKNVSKKNKHQLEEKKEKRPPGRPRLNPPREPEAREGIVETPSHAGNIIEFAYDQPSVFKKIWTHFKMMAMDTIHIIFRLDEVILWGIDHLDRSRVRVCLDATKLNRYFAAREIDVGVRCNDMQIIMNKIGSTYTRVVILSKTGLSRQNLRVILENQMKIDESHRVLLAGDFVRMENEEQFLCENDYTLKFELPGRYFKKMMADIKKSFCDVVAICQSGPGEPLYFEYATADKRVTAKNTVRKNDLIKFESFLGEDEVFRVSFRATDVRPISGAMLSKTVTIYAHSSKPLLFIMKMDNETASIRILTDIVDNRPDAPGHARALTPQAGGF